jgi:ABC-type nitrate/sulfonate/bicarbonate transport system substrate-binding protein
MRAGKAGLTGALLVVMVAVAACGGTASTGSPSPTAAATGTPAAPTAVPSESVMKSGSAKIGTGLPDAGFLPLAVAVDRLNEMGYEFELVQFDSPETQTQALASGDIDIGSAGPATIFAAAEQGLDLKIFLGYQNNSFALAAKKDLTTCESLGGQRVGVHSLESTTYALLLTYIEEECPGTEPNILVVPGSENRLAGLLADQLDAAPVDFGSLVQLKAERPDDFTEIGSFSELPVLGGVFYASPEWLGSEPELVRDFIRVYLETVQDAYDDPGLLEEKGRSYLESVDADLLADVIDPWLANEVFPADGDLEDDQLQFTYDFFAEITPYESLTDPTTIVDRTALDEVLAE